jgi:hypothetical protein
MKIRQGVIYKSDIDEYVKKYGVKKAILKLSIDTQVPEEIVKKRIEMAGY